MKVFIGSSSERKEDVRVVAEWLEEENVESLVWWKAFGYGDYTLEALLKISESVDAAIFIFAADDTTWYRGRELRSVRDNVIFEYGLFCGKLSKKRVIVLHKDNPDEITDMLGITCGNLNFEHKTKRELKEWLTEIKRGIDINIHKENCCCGIMNLADAFNLVFSKSKNIECFRVFAISTFKSVQLLRLMDDLCIKEAKVLLRQFNNDDWFYDESMNQGIERAIDSWKKMVEKNNIAKLFISRFNYHPDHGIYIIDDKYLIEGNMLYYASRHEYEFQNKVIVISNNSQEGKLWIEKNIESYDIIYENNKSREIVISQ